MLHLSDTHNLLTPKLVKSLPKADILIHTGDFTNNGTVEEIVDFNNILKLLGKKYKERVVIFGMHDVMNMGDNLIEIKKILTNATHVPINEMV